MIAKRNDSSGTRARRARGAAWRAALGIALAGAACGGRTTDPGADAAAPRPEAGLPPTSGQCTLAWRLDVCCSAAIPVSVEELQANQCLRSYFAKEPWEGGTPDECRARWPLDCALVDCKMAAPSSRVARPDGAGGCAFADECDTEADCVLVTDARYCCGCPTLMPAALAAAEPCFVADSETAPASCAPPACDAAVCGACPEPPKARCEKLAGGTLRQCQADLAP